MDSAALHIGAVTFIHRCGSSLNEHVHFHVGVVDGVFEQVAGSTDVRAQADAGADDPSSPSTVIFHAASAIDATTVAQVQATLRRRILRAFVGRGLLQSPPTSRNDAHLHAKQHPCNIAPAFPSGSTATLVVTCGVTATGQ